MRPLNKNHKRSNDFQLCFARCQPASQVHFQRSNAWQKKKEGAGLFIPPNAPAVDLDAYFILARAGCPAGRRRAVLVTSHDLPIYFHSAKLIPHASYTLPALPLLSFPSCLPPSPSLWLLAAGGLSLPIIILLYILSPPLFVQTSLSPPSLFFFFFNEVSLSFSVMCFFFLFFHTLCVCDSCPDFCL